ncbi:MAG: ATP-binding protein [bacterium]
MASLFDRVRGTRVRLRLVVSLPLLILLIASAVMVVSYFRIREHAQRQALDYHVLLARNLSAAAERAVGREGSEGDLLGELAAQVALQGRARTQEGVRFVLMRTPPAGPLLFHDPTASITTADQTNLLTLTADLATPRVLNIGIDSRPFLASAHLAVQSGFYLVALEPFTAVRSLADWILQTGVIAALLTALALFAAAWVITAPLHRLAQKTRELARQELADSEEVEAILNGAREPEETAALALAFEQAMTSLVDLKRTIHGFIESMKGGLIAANREGQVQYVNSTARELLGLEGRLDGRPVRQIVPSPQENGALLEILDDLFQKEITYGHPRELTVRNGRGERLQLGVATSVVTDAQNRVINHIVVLVDLTEMAELKDRVRRADRLSSLGSMATKVAHEIRNPLGSVKGLVQLALESTGEEEASRRYLERVVREVDRLSSIVDELLDYSQRRPLSLEWVDLNEVVKESVEVARFKDGARGGPTLLQELDLDLPRVRMDRNRFLQAVLNLVLNALQAVDPSSGVITLSTYREDTGRGPRLVVEVSDNGPGIPPEVMEHIFDPFYTTKEEGSGLGLSITHTIVQEHESRLEADTKPGQGSTFRILIPRDRWEGGGSR